MNFFGPSEIAEIASGISEKKAALPLSRLLVLGILAGAYIAFGANLAIVISHDIPKYLGNGISQLIFGAVFSTGLMLVIIGGAELFTGNNMFMIVGVLNGKCTWGNMLKNWVVVWIANFIGSLLLVGLIAIGFYGFLDPTPSAGLFNGAVGIKALSIAKGKMALSFCAVFCRAILCNWLVCMAVWLSLAAKDIAGKIFAIFFPIMAFVACGFEHSIANMFFVPMGFLVAHVPAILDAAAQTVLTPEAAALFSAEKALPGEAIAAIDAFKASVSSTFTWGSFFLKNLLPVTLGNIIGGSFFVGCLYWYSYLKRALPARGQRTEE